MKLFEECVNSTKNSVSGSVFTSEIPPSLDNPFVITVDLKVPANKSKPGDRLDKELETDGFCPSDVSLSIQGLPTGDEAPRSPAILDGDSNTEAGACI